MALIVAGTCASLPYCARTAAVRPRFQANLFGALGKDADNEVRRWFKLLAEIEHSRMPTENEISSQTRLAQAEQEGIKRRIRR